MITASVLKGLRAATSTVSVDGERFTQKLLKYVNSFVDNEIMSNQNYFTYTEAVASCSVKKVSLKFRKIDRKTPVPECF